MLIASIYLWNASTRQFYETTVKASPRRLDQYLTEIVRGGEEALGKMLAEISRAIYSNLERRHVMYVLLVPVLYYMALVLLIMLLDYYFRLIYSHIVPLLLSIMALLLYVSISYTSEKHLHGELWRGAVNGMLDKLIQHRLLKPLFEYVLTNKYILNLYISLLPFFVTTPIKVKEPPKIESVALLPLIDRSKIKCYGTPNNESYNQLCGGRQGTKSKFSGDTVLEVLMRALNNLKVKSIVTSDSTISKIKDWITSKGGEIKELNCRYDKFIGPTAFVHSLAECFIKGAKDILLNIRNLVDPSSMLYAFTIKGLKVPTELYPVGKSMSEKECYCTIDGEVLIVIIGESLADQFNIALYLFTLESDK